MAAGTQITPLRRADIPELSEFLIKGFRVPATDSCFALEVLSWKYFDGPDGPSDESTSSLVARAQDKIVGHIGMCHRQLIVPAEDVAPISTLHAIDWLGSDEHTGSGAFLMLQALATAKTQYAVGGSNQAQAVFPRLGFEPKPSLAAFHKILTPFHRLRTTTQGLLRKWAGTAKDVVSVLRTRTPPAPQTVELRPVSTFGKEIDCLMRGSSLRIVTCLRDHLLLNYFLRYPRPGFSGWTIHCSQRLIGFAILMVTSNGKIQNGKIVDCWLDTDDQTYWQSAVAALIKQLRGMSVDMVTCYGACPCLNEALAWNGFVKSGEKNVYIRDKQQLLPPGLPLAFSMLEADHAIV